MTACYLDASALVKLGTPERESDALREHLAGYDAQLTSRVAFVEVGRALMRRGRASAELVDTVAEVFIGVALVDLDDDISASASSLDPPTLRALDAIHLASALSLGAALDAFVTYDARLAEAARAAGMTVVAPA